MIPKSLENGAINSIVNVHLPIIEVTEPILPKFRSPFITWDNGITLVGHAPLRYIPKVESGVPISFNYLIDSYCPTEFFGRKRAPTWFYIDLTLKGEVVDLISEQERIEEILQKQDDIYAGFMGVQQVDVLGLEFSYRKNNISLIRALVVKINDVSYISHLESHHNSEERKLVVEKLRETGRTNSIQIAELI